MLLQNLGKKRNAYGCWKQRLGIMSESERDLKGISHRTWDPFYMGVVKEKKTVKGDNGVLLG